MDDIQKSIPTFNRTASIVPPPNGTKKIGLVVVGNGGNHFAVDFDFDGAALFADGELFAVSKTSSSSSALRPTAPPAASL